MCVYVCTRCGCIWYICKYVCDVHVCECDGGLCVNEVYRCGMSGHDMCMGALGVRTPCVPGAGRSDVSDVGRTFQRHLGSVYPIPARLSSRSTEMAPARLSASSPPPHLTMGSLSSPYSSSFRKEERAQGAQERAPPSPRSSD